jgi:uncharacterized protein YjbI with pentapeptide repeats
VRARLSRRVESNEADPVDAGAAGPDDGRPLDLSRQDLRDQDIAALAGAGRGGSGLRDAVLRETVWRGTRLAGLDLTGADLSDSDLRATTMQDVDLTRARLTGTRLTGARLRGVRLAGADLRRVELTGARLTEVDLTGVEVGGSVWTRAALLGGRTGSVIGAAELATAAVAGRDPAEAFMAAPQGLVRSVVGLPGTGLVAVATGGAIEVIDAGSQRIVRRFGDDPRSAVRSVGSVGLPDGRVLLISGSTDGTVRLWALTNRPPLDGGRVPRPESPGAQRHEMRAHRGAVADRDERASVDPVDVEPVSTMTTSRAGVWATLLADGCSYKSVGEVSDVLWWAIKSCRFEAGDLDSYDSRIRRLPLDQPII